MVQFSLKMQDNVVAKWAAHYVDYGRIKKGIKAVAKQMALSSMDQRAREKTRLLSGTPPTHSRQSSAQPGLFEGKTVEELILAEIDKVQEFYSRKTEHFHTELDLLLHDHESLHNRLSVAGSGRDRVGSDIYLSIMHDSDGESDDDHEADNDQDNRSRARSSSGSVPGRIMRIFSHAPGGKISRNANRSVKLTEEEKKEYESLMRAMKDLYRNMTLLDNFAILNYTACVKIVKKADKQLRAWQPPMRTRVMEYVHKQAFYRRRSLHHSVQRCEEEFAKAFCGGDVPQSRGMLLPNKLDQNVKWGQFHLGYHLGMAAVLAFWMLWDCGVEVMREHKDVSVVGQPAYGVYRAHAGLLILHWAWGASCYAWHRARINFIYLFELDPRSQTSAVAIFHSASIETVVFLINLLVYYKMQVKAIPAFIHPGYIPLLLCVFTLTRLVHPFHRTVHIWKTLGRVLVGLWVKVDFFDTYIADVLTSSVKTSLDIAWTIGYFATGDYLLSRHAWRGRAPEDQWENGFWYKQVLVPFLCILPLWLRFQQCLRRYFDTGRRFPNLANAFKYALAQVVAVMGVFRTPQATLDMFNGTWLLLYICSSLYSFAWDVIQDWGLGDPKYGFLSKHRMYHRAYYYYMAIVMDLVLRFNWVYSFIPPGTVPLLEFPAYVTTLVIFLEYFRRTIWGFFRLEHEHLRNVEGYRSVDFVPLHFHTAKQQEVEEDGNQNRAWILTEVLFVAMALVSITVLSVMLAKWEDVNELRGNVLPLAHNISSHHNATAFNLTRGAGQ